MYIDCKNIYNIFELTTGRPFGMAHIFAIIIFAIFLIITVGIITFYIIKYRKKGEPRYFVKDDGGEFELFCKSTDNAEMVVASIVDSTRRKSFYVNDNKGKIDRASGLASEDNGFYDFLTTPNKVISKDICAAPRYRYKKRE